MRKIGNVRWWIIGLVTLGTIINYIDRNALGVLAPQLKEVLNFTTQEYSYIVAAFQIAYTIMQPVCGYLTDVIGLKFGYALFALLWGTAAALHAFAGGWVSMAVFRAMLGFSEAAAIPSGVKASTLWFPAKERSIATGWFNTGTSIGAMIATPLVIWLSVTWSWQASFIVTGLLGVAMAGIWLVLYDNPDKHPRLSKEEYEYIQAGQEPSTGDARPALRDILSRRKFWGIALARFLSEPAWQTFSFWIPMYMVTVRGMDIKQFALFGWLPFLAADVGGVLGGYLSPYLTRTFRMSLINSRIAGVGIGAVCMIGPGLISFASDPLTAILLFSLGSFAHQMLSGLLYAIVTDAFEKNEVATITGLGGMFGWTGGLLFSLVIGQLANTIGYEPLFACLTVFDLLAFFITLAVFRQSRKPDSPDTASKPRVAIPGE
ncbi:MFS transporter [Azospirillum sp. YIM B02556]|uniref:MFS transporter n=1 Tax=Azospirillum endophyticum TaxID=2800326 RepID=A0ABS1FBS5_9PROT|nr:MFS transporter [Azospirillum endophyticum]MBK1840864.1 MFS transporter [Azospirillum endophyticum]